MKKWLSGNLRTGERKKPKVQDGGKEEKDEAFPEHDVLMIFGGPAACESKRKQKTTRREVFAAEPATPAYLRWSDSPITRLTSPSQGGAPWWWTISSATSV